MARRISPRVIEKIRYLRTRGYSLPEIVKKTGVGHGSAFRYIKGVQIGTNYIKSWFGKRGGSKKRKAQAEKNALIQAKRTISSLSDNERLIFITALYWGEGNKKDFCLTNSDPMLIKVFVMGLRRILNISKDHIRVSIRIFEDMDKNKCLDYWSKIVGIPTSDFVNIDVLKGKKEGKLLYGICRIRILKGANMLKYLTALKQVIAEKFASP